MKKILMLVTMLFLLTTAVACKDKNIEFTVTFESNGGSEVQPIIFNEENQKISEPVVTRDGYSLDGWYRESNFVNKWNFSINVVDSDLTLYAKWEEGVISVPSDTSIINLTGVFLGGIMNDFPDSNQKLGSSSLINKRPSTQNRVRRSLPYSENAGMMYKALGTQLETQNDPLYIYFNWDGSFNWLEDYDYTVNTSRDINGQEKQYFNLKDYYDLKDYEVFVNYIRYRVNTIDDNGNPVEKVFYEGDAMVESSAGTSFILNRQSIMFNDNDTAEDTSDDSFDIAIRRDDVDDVLATYLLSDPNATLDIIGIQLFISHRGKLLNYWDSEETPDHGIYRDEDLSKFALYDPKVEVENTGGQWYEAEFLVYGSGKSIVSYYPRLSTSNSEIPQNQFSNYHGESVTDFADYLGLIKVFYSLEDEEISGETIYLEQKKIEFAGGSKKPYIGLNKDKNVNADDGIIYYSMPVLANTNAVYERKENIDKPEMHPEFEFLIFITLKDGVVNPGTWSITGKEFTETFRKLDENGNPVDVPYEYPSSHPVTSHLFPDTKDLIAVYSISYNKDIVNLLDGSVLTYPGTNEPVRANLKNSSNWIYQGSIPIQLPEGITINDVVITEGSEYSYIDYNFDLDKVIKDEIGQQVNLLSTSPEIRRSYLTRVLQEFYKNGLDQNIHSMAHVLLPENVKYFSGSSSIDEDGNIEIHNSYLDERKGRLSYSIVLEESGNRIFYVSLLYTEQGTEPFSQFFYEKGIPWKFDNYIDEEWWQTKITLVEALTILREQPEKLSPQEKDIIFSYLGIERE